MILTTVVAILHSVNATVLSKKNVIQRRFWSSIYSKIIYLFWWDAKAFAEIKYNVPLLEQRNVLRSFDCGSIQADGAIRFSRRMKEAPT